MLALITGAASGIGRATALKFAEDRQRLHGTAARLFLVDLSRDRLDETAEAVRRAGGEVAVGVGSVGDADRCAAFVAAAVDFCGGLDVLVSNAGMTARTSLLDLGIDDYDEIFAVNTRATWALGRAAHASLAASRGCIVATASLAASHPVPHTSAYSASKAALVMLVRQMALEWGPDGIRCNCVSPGSTETLMSEKRYASEELRAYQRSRNPLGMLGMPEHQAAAIAFLASPEAAYVTGVDLVVDGGADTATMASSGQSWQKAMMPD